ncbi:MAG: hypothetical protein M3M96_09670 [Candidatus Eremiobacteraeota bacterium]|nr:hypothetical protein [Candidatus Eremiobacteraeota bacterium]
MKVESTALAVAAPPADFSKRAYVVGGTDGAVLSAIVCVENTLRGSTFVARVLNQSSEMMFGSIYGETAAGLESLRPNEFRIPAQGLDDITIVAPRRFVRRFRRVVVTMRGSTLDYSMDAAVPGWRPPLPVRIASGAAVLAAAFALFSIGSLTVGAVPVSVPARALVQIPYAAFGAGTLDYAVRDSGQRVVSSGSLPLGAGTIAFTSGTGPNAYRADLRFHQLFALRERVAGPVVVVTPAPVPVPPEIRAFEVGANQVRAGDPIDVRYSVAAAEGSVRIVDVAGITLASASLDPSGHSALTAPAVSLPTPVRVEVHAARAGRVTQAGSTVLIVPRENTAALVAGAPVEARDIVRLPVPYAIAGRGLVVELLAHQFQMHLVLQDPGGRVIASQDPPPSAAAVALDIPASAAGNYVLVVTIDANGGAQSVILPVPVRR